MVGMLEMNNHCYSIMPPSTPFYSSTQTNRRKRVPSPENKSKPSRSAEPLVTNLSQGSDLTLCSTPRCPRSELEDAIKSIDECFKNVFQRHGELLTVTNVGRPYTSSCAPATTEHQQSVKETYVRKGYGSEIMLHQSSLLLMSLQGVPTILHKTCLDILKRIEGKPPLSFSFAK